MTSVRELARQINGVAPVWSNINIQNRGVPLYSDPLLKGEARFAKKTGNNIGLISSDTTFELVETALRVSRTLKPTGQVPTWVSIGSILNIGPDIELQEVDDVIDNTIVLKKDLAITHLAGVKVELHAVQILSEGAFDEDATSMSIRTHFQIMEGDRISIPALSGTIILAESLFDIEILTATQTSDDGSDVFLRYVYSVTLKTGLPRDVANGSTVFQRAFPAYFSEFVRVSLTSASLSDLGPFLMDNLSGRLKEGKKIEEHYTALFYDAAQNLIGTTTPISLTKNHPIVNTDVPADVILFWDLLQGKMQYTNFKTVGIADTDGQWGASMKIVPNIPAGTKWKIRVTPRVATKITVQMGTTNVLQVFDLSASNIQTIEVGTETIDDPLDYIRFTFDTGVAGATVDFDTWEVSNQTVIAFIKYQILGVENTEALWQSSGTIFKPYFTSIDSLKVQYDSGQRYNASGVYF